MISRILDRLYVGDSGLTIEHLEQHGITHIINVGGVELDRGKLEWDSNRVNRLVLYWEHLTDDGKNPIWKFSTILGKLSAVISSTYSHRALICCRAGFSRSVFIIILWLERMGMSRDEAYEFIKKKHPIAQVNLDLLRSV